MPLCGIGNISFLLLVTVLQIQNGIRYPMVFDKVGITSAKLYT